MDEKKKFKVSDLSEKKAVIIDFVDTILGSS